MKKRSKKQQHYRLRGEQLENRHMLSSIDVFFPALAEGQQPDFADIAFETEVVKKPSAWRLDANNDGALSPSDALTRINLLNTLSQPIYVDKSFEQGLWDANDDFLLTPEDVLWTINGLNNDALWGQITTTHEISVSLTETATQDVDVAPGTHDVVMSSTDVVPTDYVFVDIAQSFSPHVGGDIDRITSIRLCADIDHDGKQELLGLMETPKSNSFFTPIGDKLIPLDPGAVTTFTVLGNASYAQNPILSVQKGNFQPSLVTYSGGSITRHSSGAPHAIRLVNPMPTIIDVSPTEVTLGDTNVLMASATYSGPRAESLIQFARIHVTGGENWLSHNDIGGRFWLTPTLYDAVGGMSNVNTNSINWITWTDTDFYDTNCFNSLRNVSPDTLWEVRGTLADNEASKEHFVGIQWRVEFLDMAFSVSSYGPWNTLVA